MPEHLPNLHPAVVHFPIALLTIGVALDVAALVFRRSVWLDRAVVSLYLLGTGAAILTWLTGRLAADSVGLVGPAAEELMATHRGLASRTILIFSVAALGRAGMQLLHSRLDSGSQLALRGLLLLAALFGAWLLGQTADLGGGLVFTHGVAVKAVAEARALAEQSQSPESLAANRPGGAGEAQPGLSSLQRSGKGEIRWSPGPDDGDALGTVIEVVQLSPGASIHVPDGTGSAPGLRLESTGRVLLLIPESLGDVQAELDLDASRFEGTVGLVHHYVGPTTYESMTLSSAGEARLTVLSPTGESTLDEAGEKWPSGRFRVAVSAAGTHLKGFLGTRTAVHGHRSAETDSGQVGVLLDGSGEVSVFELKVTRASTQH